MKIDNLIIGSGITGLSFACFSKGDYIILEKESTPGGYCKTSYNNGFVWDYSGHFFHFTNNEIKNFIFENIEGDIVTVSKKTKIYYKNKFIDFPFQKNIHQLDKDEFIDCLHDFYLANQSNNEDKSFEDFVYNKFGKSISDKFLIPYNEKLYSCDLNKLDKECMGRFFPESNFENTIKNFKIPDNSSYNDNFIYPAKGALQFVESLLKRIDKNKILFNKNILSIDIDKKEAITSDGEKIKYEKLISTIPLNSLLKIIGYEKNIKLESNKVLVINMGFETPINNDSHWIYFPEKDYNFYRIGFYSNILGQERGSLYVEIGFEQNKEIDIKKELELTITNLKKIGFINSDPISYETIVMNPAYCHITTENENKIQEIFKQLKEKDLYSIGRYGRWSYCSIEDNIIESKSLSDKINTK